MNGYEMRPPGPQNALDIFADEWTSLLPTPDADGLIAGTLPLFADTRVHEALAVLGGVHGSRVLELGPLEGAHSWMLEKAGAREVVAIEGNRRAYLRCLVLKEILKLIRVNYLCGDFAPYLNTTREIFDLVFACGVLYHQLDPMQLLADMARVAPAIYVWTHYFDADLIAANPSMNGKVGELTDAEFAGRPYRRAEYRYLQALDWSGFCGGSQTHAHWLPRADILDSLEVFGFRSITITREQPDHPNGPSFAFVAKK